MEIHDRYINPFTDFSFKVLANLQKTATRAARAGV